MCMNRQNDEKQQQAIDRMACYAKMILQGAKVEDIALDEATTVEAVEAVIEGIKDVNPYLYKQVQEKLHS